MSDVIKELLPVIIPTISTVFAAIGAVIVSWLTTSKTKAEAQSKVNELAAKNAELEIEKIELQKAIYNGTYILCPNCGEKIYLKDMKFKVDKEVSE